MTGRQRAHHHITSGHEPWMDTAACRGQDPADWFPTGQPGHGGGQQGPAYQAAYTAAVTICSSCPVRLDCLNHALTHHEQGIWGGTDDEQRRHIRRWRYAQPRAVEHTDHTPCVIDGCPHNAIYNVAGHPDDVDLCTEHLNLACDCDQWAGGIDPVEWCPLHGPHHAERVTRNDTP